MKCHLLDSARPWPRRSGRPEDRAIDLNAAVAPYLGAAIVGLGVAVLLLAILALLQARRIGRLRRRIDGLTRGVEGQSLDAVLHAHLDKVIAVGRELDVLSARSAVQEAVGRRSIQRVGLVRFNPFEDTGGNQSFAIALIDGAGSGVVVSSLHSRTGTRVYAKAVTDGRADGALSQEETDALGRALATPPPASPGGRATGRDRIAGPA